MSEILSAIYVRDLRLAMRRRMEALMPAVFFVVAVSLFPVGVGPEPETLRRMAPGVVWVCALLAAMLSLGSLYAADHADGSLEQMLLSGQPAMAVVAAKAAVHWTVSGLPLVAMAPLLGLLLDMDVSSLQTLLGTLLVGTPILSLLGSVGAALTLGLRGAGMLIVLLVLPLSIPVLIFGTGAVAAVQGGQSPAAHYSLLGALLILTALVSLPATAAALRISLE